MSSIVAICNLALSNLGKANIQSIEDTEPEARACRQFYDLSRDLLLQVYPWRFAQKIAAMGELTNDRPGEWGRCYTRPTDCLKILDVLPQSSTVPLLDIPPAGPMGFPYEVSGSRIYCALPAARLSYIARITDPTRYTPLFIDALGWHLAVRLAMPLTRDPKQRETAYQMAMAMQSAAQIADANETRATYDHETEMNMVREP